MTEESWALEHREVSTKELDDAVRAVKEARMEYDKASAVSDEKHRQVKDLEQKLVALLDASGKSIYEVEGVARATIVIKTAVTVPKDLEKKEAFFKWIENKFGKEGLLAYTTINYQTLNSLYNQEMEQARDRGEDFSIDGIDLPTVSKVLQLRAR